jgi:hypothetical protein
LGFCTARRDWLSASRIDEQLARMREEDQRNIATAEEQHARERQERFDAQRAAARAQLSPVARDDWWDKANPEMIDRVHEIATAWKAYEPEPAQALERIRDQVQNRYGIGVNNAGADETSVSAVSPGHFRPTRMAKKNGPKPSAARNDEAVVGGAAGAGANRQDNTARQAQTEPAYDSPERHQQLGKSREGKGAREAVDSRLLAAKHQGTPATEAVTQKPSLVRTSKTAKQGGKNRTVPSLWQNS